VSTIFFSVIGNVEYSSEYAYCTQLLWGYNFQSVNYISWILPWGLGQQVNVSTWHSVSHTTFEKQRHVRII